MKKSYVAIICFVLIAFAAAALVVFKPWGSKTGPGRYGDWLVKCEAKSESNTSSGTLSSNAKENCLMTQLILAEKTDEQVLAVAVGFWPGKDHPQIAFHTPSTIEKAEGLTVQVDQNDIYKIPVGVCTSTRCTALDYIPEDVKRQMLTGRQMIVAYKLHKQDKRTGILVSLNGFREALGVLEKRR